MIIDTSQKPRAFVRRTESELGFDCHAEESMKDASTIHKLDQTI